MATGKPSPYIAVIVMLCVAAGLAAACTVGPSYRRPSTAADQQDAYQHGKKNVKAIASGDFNRWWRSMNDPVMNAYVAVLMNGNLQIKEAAARIDQARARLEMKRGAQLPGLSLSAGASRQFQPLDASGLSSALPTSPGAKQRMYTTRLEAGLQTSWQVDIFKKIRRQTAAAEKNYTVSRIEAEALAHSLVAELARRRVAVVTLQRRVDVAEQAVKNRTRTLRTVTRRYGQGAGNSTAVDVNLARAGLGVSLETLLRLRGELTREEQALQILLGRPPGAAGRTADQMPIMPPSENVPAGIPAQLIDRRPDLKANELRMAAAVDRIGVAVAQLYPDLTLTGNIGYQADELQGFFSDSNLFGALLADILTPLFQGGRLRAGIDLEEAKARELAAVYARQILTAINEVETALSNERVLSDRLHELKIQLENIRLAEQHLARKYRNGLVSLLDLLEVRQRLHNTETSYLVTGQAAWNNRISLYLALGGDWFENRPTPAPVSLPTKEGDS